MSPSRIAGRYELQDQLGEGGMGVVWRALDTKTGSAVAIKLMKDISDPVAVELFAKEWKALAEISHPNIVEVRDVDVIEENRQKRPFFVMPLLRGATLADLIANASARLTLDRIVEITTHVCRGLQAAHQCGLVHRDLKPSNIFVLDDDTAKIIDFGVVHLAGSKSVTGQKGTFHYMSPEQAQLKEITPASDLFSLGVILYETLTGRNPFARKTADETMKAVIKYIPPPVSEINPSINQSVSKVVHKCLAKQAIHRFTSARELAEFLQKAVRNEPVFDSARIEPRIERAKVAFRSGDDGFASEILAELEAEGNLDPRITVLRMQIDLTMKQKKVRQLLESARARMEQDEIPLALDKIREALELDPENSDALALRQTMEKQRSETQIAKWLELAQTHLENRDFSAARNAAQEVLAINCSDRRALDLLERVESTEADAKRIREQKEQLYSSAMRAFQNGEIETALSKLERLFSVARANPNAAIPERDAVYQSFYNDVRSEHDGIHAALEDAQRQFSEKNFAGAMAVCEDLLARYPNDGTFHALKIRIEDAERQELSSYIADISKRLEAEPDLDRRVNIVREACERYPSETQFARQFKLTCERRDLVNSIVAKARQYEERGQHAEAISQWDTLRNIHPQYPGIAFELEQCKNKRDRQAREEEQSRLVQEIDGLMESRAYAKAVDCAEAALLDFPGDAELSGLRTLAQQGLERAKESRRLFEEGQQALTGTDLGRATELLRCSLNLDPRGPGLRDAVVNVLTERARALVEENWREAETLYQEASELDATHPAVRALRSSISEAKRQIFVGQCLTDCRELVAAGKAQEAAERIRAARVEYPNESRLEQYEAGLQKEVRELRYKEERGRHRVALGENRSMAEQNSDRENLRAILERLYAIRARHPNDAEIGQTVAESELAVKHAAKLDDLSELLTLPTMLTGTDGRVATPSPPQAAPHPGGEKGPRLVGGQSGEQTKLFQPSDRTPKKSRLQDSIGSLRAIAIELGRTVATFIRSISKWFSWKVGSAVALLAIAGVAGYVILHRSHLTRPTPAPITNIQLVQITTDPPDSAVMSEGTPVANGMARVGSTIEVSHLGYKPKQVQIDLDSDKTVKLDPEAVRLSVHTSESGGSVELDGQKIGNLDNGSLEEDLTPDGGTHKLSLVSQGKPLFTLQVQVPAGGQPRVTALDASDVFAITSLGSQATLYGGSQLKNARLGDQPITVSPSGTDMRLSDQNHEFVFGKGNDQGSVSIEMSNAPVLALQSLNAEGQVHLTSNTEKAVLTVDGSPVPRRKNGWTVVKPPGPHTFVLSAEGYESQTWVMTMQRRQMLRKSVDLASKVVSPVMAALVISGGTPDAAVEIDEKRAGKLDATGSLRLHSALTVGKHNIAIVKPGYATRQFETSVNPASPGQTPADVLLSKTLLSPLLTTLAFEVNAKGVTVKYRRPGDEQFREVSAFEKIPLAPGPYEIAWEAPGYQPGSTTINLSGEAVTLPLNLVPAPDYEFADPSQIVHEGGWIKARTPGTYVNLRPGRLREVLVFTRPGKTLFWNKKVEWIVENGAQEAHIHYALEGQPQNGKLTRKLVIGDDTSNQEERKVNAEAAGQPGSLSVHVRVEGGRVVVANDKGQVLDEFKSPDQDFSKGRIAIKTDSLFVVRSDN